LTADRYLVGVDVGTTNTKCAVLDVGTGEVVAVASRPTATHHPRPDWSEFDPAEMWDAIAAGIREATAGRASDVRGIAVASMAEAGVPVSRAGAALCPIIAWHDNRSLPQAERLFDLLGDERVFRITGQTRQAKFSLCKLLWLREHCPEVLREAQTWLCVADFALFGLSGSRVTDYSLASRTLAFDQESRSWSDDMLAAVGVGPELFPPAFQSGTVIGHVSAEGSARTRLPAGTPVVTGGHDHLCGAVAAGVVSPGALLDSMGTAEAYILLTERYSPSSALMHGGFSHYRHVVPGCYVVLGGLSASGGQVDWLVSQFWMHGLESPVQGDRAFARALDAASAISPGADGVFWMPHIAGSGSPWADDRSRAAIVGLTRAHGRGHVARALIEGLCYWMRENLDVLAEATGAVAGNEITAIGGGARNRLWMQTKADVTGRTVRVVDVPEATAVGAALLAGVGVGVYPSVQVASASIRRGADQYLPDPTAHATYDRLFERIYLKLYPALRETMHAIDDENRR
jgi:xylulokinase